MIYRSVKQYESTDCASACIASISWYYGKKVSVTKMHRFTNKNKNGSSILDIVDACKKIGLKANAFKRTENFDVCELMVPCIAHVLLEDGSGHYIVIYKIGREKILINDPALGILNVKKNDFLQSNFSEKSPYIWSGVAVFIEPSEEFEEIEQGKKKQYSFWNLLIEENGIALKIVILSFVSMLLNLLNAFYLKIILDIVIPKMWLNSLILVTFCWIFLNVINIFVSRQRVKKAMEMSKSINIRLSLNYYKKILNLSFNELESRKNGELLSRFQDIANIQEVLVMSTLILPIDLLLIIIVGIFLGLKSSAILGLVLCMCIGYLFIAISFKGKYLVDSSKQMIAHANMTSHFVDSLEGNKTIKAYCQEEKFYQKGKDKIIDWQSCIVKVADIENNQTTLYSIINSVGRLIILCIGAIEVMYGCISVGDLITYNMLIGYLLDPITDIINIQPQFHAAQVAMERLDAVIQSATENEKGQELISFKEIKFENIDFKYEADESVLKEINIKISNGQKIAIIGDSGSGKTTLAKLLIKLYSSNNGYIQFDDKDIKNINKESIRKNIIYVSQDDLILSESIRENLKFGQEEISEEKMVSIAQKIGVHEFVVKMPRMYESILEERGANLSGGQKQKISITRAILRKPKVLVLDEATCSIDPLGENKIIKYLKEDDNLTLIVITHRLESVSEFDCIYVMDKGKIVASGKYKDILTSFPQYRGER